MSIHAPDQRRPRARRRRLLFVVYVVLLVLSHLTQLRPDEVGVAPGKSVASVENGSVRIAYRDSGGGTPVIYLHGSPGSSDDSVPLARVIGSGRRVLAPDLPGFGDSEPRVPDYGIEAHARYVLAWMDAIGVERAHVIGHSMGAGVAYHLSALAPERVISITSYGGIGVQEGEGSGDYHFERMKYVVGYAFIVVLPELIPHFGWLGPHQARHAFMRNFLDSDLRPVRSILENLSTPLLLVHGRDDPLVPLRTAEEHHRIVKHSELVLLDASHFLVFSQAGATRLAAEIRPFLDRHPRPGIPSRRRTVDRSDGPRPTTPLPSALHLEQSLGPWGEIALLIGATFVSEDLTCISAGLLVRDRQLDLFVAVVGCILGIFITDMGLWVVGRLVGRRALRWAWIERRVPPHHVARFARSFDRHLGKAVVLSRFLPGTRVPMYVAAGAVGRRPVAFLAWLLVAAAIWTPILVLASSLLGPVVARPFQAWIGVSWLSWLAVVVVLLVVLRTIGLLVTWRGRQRLRAKVERLWRWEFWPPWLFYIPVVWWVALLALRYGLTVPTATNPAFPLGGFVGESKYEILAQLAPEWIVPSCLVDTGEVTARVTALRQEVERNGWSFPLILKPNEGQRGAGLRLARSWDEVVEYLEGYPPAVLVQTYDRGPYEAGVFYYRIPGAATGKIFSITDKSFPALVGDGRSTVEELILGHSRLRMQARTFLRRHADVLERVLDPGVRFPLAIAGNHCQGTMFTDGVHLISSELEQTIDSIAQACPGFYFGRFDLRYRDAESFRAGREFRIVELNGMTSESTNIYDPSWSLLSAYRTLFRQWELAFRIGAMNRARGHAVSTVVELARAAWAHYRHRPALPAD